MIDLERVGKAVFRHQLNMTQSSFSLEKVVNNLVMKTKFAETLTLPDLHKLGWHSVDRINLVPTDNYLAGVPHFSIWIEKGDAHCASSGNAWLVKLDSLAIAQHSNVAYMRRLAVDEPPNDRHGSVEVLPLTVAPALRNLNCILGNICVDVTPYASHTERKVGFGYH